MVIRENNKWSEMWRDLGKQSNALWELLSPHHSPFFRDSRL